MKTEPVVLREENASIEINEEFVNAVMSGETAEVAVLEYDLTFWRKVIRLKREIKQHEKSAIVKRKELAFACNEILE